MLKSLLQTLSKTQAEKTIMEAQKEFGGPNVYGFQYWGKDGLFHYEVLVKEDNHEDARTLHI